MASTITIRPRRPTGSILRESNPIGFGHFVTSSSGEMKIVKKRPLMSEMKLIDSEAFFRTPYGHVNSCRSHNIRLILRHWPFFNNHCWR
jgi:hypothetical protein